MTAIASINRLYQNVKRADRIAGRYLGSAEFIRAAHIDPLEYAVRLGLRVVMVGSSAALLGIMFFVVYAQGGAAFHWIATMGLGLGLLAISRVLYPLRLGFALVLLIELGAVVPIGLVAGVFGLPWRLTFEVLFASGLSYVVLGVLVAMEIAYFTGEQLP